MTMYFFPVSRPVPNGPVVFVFGVYSEFVVIFSRHGMYVSAVDEPFYKIYIRTAGDRLFSMARDQEPWKKAPLFF